jgi:hypothetical protein
VNLGLIWRVVKLNRSLLLLGTLTVTGCASLPPAPAPRPDTEINAPFSQTWDAVVDFFGRSSIPIKTIDRSSGIIAAEATRLAGDNGKYAVCTNPLAHVPVIGGSFNVLVRGDSARSIVRATAVWVGSQVSGMDIHCVTTDVWEKDFESAIKQRSELRTAN